MGFLDFVSNAWDKTTAWARGAADTIINGGANAVRSVVDKASPAVTQVYNDAKGFFRNLASFPNYSEL